jgi:hypothetical protein
MLASGNGFLSLCQLGRTGINEIEGYLLGVIFEGLLICLCLFPVLPFLGWIWILSSESLLWKVKPIASYIWHGNISLSWGINQYVKMIILTGREENKVGYCE